MYLCVCTCVCVFEPQARSWFGLALCLVQSDNSDVCPGGLHYCSRVSVRMYACISVCVCVCQHVCAFVCELVFVHVPVASLLTGNAGNASGSDPTPCPACPAHSRGTLMGSDGGTHRGWSGGSDSSVTLTRACRPLSQSGIAHPQCQKGEFIFLAPALPSAGNRGPPSAGSLSPSALSLFSPSRMEIYWGGGNERKKKFL